MILRHQVLFICLCVLLLIPLTTFAQETTTQEENCDWFNESQRVFPRSLPLEADSMPGDFETGDIVSLTTMMTEGSSGIHRLTVYLMEETPEGFWHSRKVETLSSGMEEPLLYQIPASGKYYMSYRFEPAANSGWDYQKSCSRPANAEPLAARMLSAEGDVDGDGIANNQDNCVLMVNTRQENQWGLSAGDACDTYYYYAPGKMKGYPRLNSTLELQQDCRGQACATIAHFDPGTLSPEVTPLRLDNPGRGNWSTVIEHLGGNVYQVSVYRSAPAQGGSLVDDQLLLYLLDNGSWFFRQREEPPEQPGASGSH